MKSAPLDQDEEELIWDAEKALVSHREQQALELYLKALYLPSGPSAVASLAYGKLISRGTNSFEPEEHSDEEDGSWPILESVKDREMIRPRRASILQQRTLSPPFVPSSSFSATSSGATGLDSIGRSSSGQGNGHTGRLNRREWEKMNKAAGAFLVGLLVALEDCLKEIDRLDGKIPWKGKMRSPSQGVGANGGEGDEKWPVVVSFKLAHNLFSNLLTLYRRGLLLPSDPIVPLPVPDPSTFLRSSPAMKDFERDKSNVWVLGELVSSSVLQADWVKMINKCEGVNGMDYALAQSLTMHAHYLLALTSHETNLGTSLSHLQAVLSFESCTLKEAQELLTSARPRALALERKLVSQSKRTAASTPQDPSLLSPLPIKARKIRARAPKPFAVSPSPSVNGLPCFPFPRQPAPPKASTAVSPSHTHTYQSSRTHSSTELDEKGNDPSLPFVRSHGRKSSNSSSIFNPANFIPRLSRRPSTYSFSTNRSVASLSPSLYSLKLQDTRSNVAPGLIDDLIVEGEVSTLLTASSTPGWGSGGWNWFGSKSQAEGTLRRMQTKSRTSSPLVSPSPLNQTGKPTTHRRPPVSSIFTSPPVSTKPSPETPPPLPHSSGLYPSSTTTTASPRTPSSPCSIQTYSQPTSNEQRFPRKPHEETHLTKFGDQSLDPQLRQLEMDSKVTMASRCDVCGTEGVNLPACPRCGIRFCSRECRVGELAAGDGKKHICGILKTRKH